MGREFADAILGLFWVAVTHLCLLQVDADWQETPIPAAVVGQKIHPVKTHGYDLSAGNLS